MESRIATALVGVNERAQRAELMVHQARQRETEIIAQAGQHMNGVDAVIELRAQIFKDTMENRCNFLQHQASKEMTLEKHEAFKNQKLMESLQASQEMERRLLVENREQAKHLELLSSTHPLAVMAQGDVALRAELTNAESEIAQLKDGTQRWAEAAQTTQAALADVMNEHEAEIEVLGGILQCSASPREDE